MPLGWPKAMAPPLGFHFSGSTPCPSLSRIFITARVCDANASLHSTTSMSSSLRPVRSRTFLTAMTGAMPMYFGSRAPRAQPTNRPSGFNPSPAHRSPDITRTATPPSFSPDEFPAVTVPPFLKAGFRAASFSRVVARGCSSRSKTTGSPFLWGTFTATISSLKNPDSMARIARSWLRSANRSCSSREIPYSDARISAMIPMATFVSSSGPVCRTIHAGGASEKVCLGRSMR